MQSRTNRKTCILCLQNPPIQNSHIVPKLVLKWILENAPVEHLRWSRIPNKPFQDGWKGDYLCMECEGRLSTIENQFKTEFFDPIVNSKSAVVQYSDFLLPFSISLYLRHLRFSLDQDPTFKGAEALWDLSEQLRRQLFNFLYVGDYPDVHSYVVHLPFVDNSSFFEPGVNQYFLSVDGFWFDYHIPPDKVFYIGAVKLPMLQFVFGGEPLDVVTSDAECRAELARAKINRNGAFALTNLSQVILPGLLGEDYNKRAVDLRESVGNLSSKQTRKIVDEITSHPNPESTIFHIAYEKDLKLAAFKEGVKQSAQQ